MNPILAGIIGGAGVGMTNVAGQLEEQRKEALKQQEIKIAQQRADQEQQYRDASLTIERDKLNQSSTPIGEMFKYIGAPLPRGC